VLRFALFCADAVVIAVSVAFLPRLFPPRWQVSRPPHGAPPSLEALLFMGGWLAMLAAYRLYDPEYLLDGFQQYARLAQASTAGLVLLLAAVIFMEGDVPTPRSQLLAVWFVTFALLLTTRFLARRLVWRLRRRGVLQARMLVIGVGEDARAIAEQITSYARDAACVVGYLDEYRPIGTEVPGGVVLGEPLALAQAARQTGATEAIIVPQAVSWESLQALLQGDAHAWGLERLWLAPAFRDLLTTGMEIHQRGSLPLLAVAGPRLSGLEAALKRGFDVLLAVLVLPFVLPVGIAVAAWLAAVRHVTPLCRRDAVGAGGRRITLVTFPPLPSLCRSHLWRLPALYNVFRGDLSLVGPRPITASLAEQYRPWRVMLTAVRPGLTGPWWLLSGSQHVSVAAEAGVDLAYIRHYTIWSDVRLLALTALRLLTLARAQEQVRAGEAQAGAQPGDQAELAATSAESRSPSLSGGTR
jgi:lipopolysaccharide/colanic/teichoic acid biosynthesis glycosyltransferase